MKKYLNLLDRLHSNSVVQDCGYESPCWVWLCHCSKNGYPRINLRINGKHVKKYAHRVSYEVHKGTRVRRSLQVDHLCRNRRCINPDHLQLLGAKAHGRKTAQYRVRDLRYVQTAYVSDATQTVRDFTI